MLSKGSLQVLAGMVAVILVGYFLTGMYSRYFDLRWDEEVKLADGHVILVHVTHTYERRGFSISRYDEDRITFRRKTMVFESATGHPETLTTRQPIAYLGEIGGKWYIVISGQGPFGNFPDEMPGRWGNDYTNLEQRIAVLTGETFNPIQWEQAPSQLTKMNLIRTAFFREFLEWDGKRLTLEQKDKFNAKYPSPNGLDISRPNRMTNI